MERIYTGRRMGLSPADKAKLEKQAITSRYVKQAAKVTYRKTQAPKRNRAIRAIVKNGVRPMPKNTVPVDIAWTSKLEELTRHFAKHSEA